MHTRPLSATIIGQAIEEGVLSSRFAQRFKEIGPLTTTVMSHYLEMPFNEEYALVSCVKGSEADAQALWMILNAIIDRAAKLTAANLSATILKSGAGADPRRPVLINADGTTFYKTEYLKSYTEFYLKASCRISTDATTGSPRLPTLRRSGQRLQASGSRGDGRLRERLGAQAHHGLHQGQGYEG